MADPKQNPFVAAKKHNQGLLVDLAQKNPGWSRKKLVAQFAILAGLTQKKAEEYYTQAIDAEVLDAGEEGERL